MYQFCCSRRNFIYRVYSLLDFSYATRARVRSFEFAVYWLIESSYRALSRYLYTNTLSGFLKPPLLVRNARGAMTIPDTRAWDMSIYVHVLQHGCARCFDISWLADDTDAWRFAADRLTFTKQLPDTLENWISIIYRARICQIYKNIVFVL